VSLILQLHFFGIDILESLSVAFLEDIDGDFDLILAGHFHAYL
jgi:hypothetical protein